MLCQCRSQSWVCHFWAFSPDIFPQTPWKLYAPLMIKSIAYLQRIPLLSKKTSSKFLSLTWPVLPLLDMEIMVSCTCTAAALVVGHNLKVSFQLPLSPYKESWFCFCSSFSLHGTKSAAMCLVHKLSVKMHHQVLYYRPGMLQSYATCSHWSLDTLFPHFDQSDWWWMTECSKFSTKV